MDCQKLHAFADGELPAAEVPRFQQHLARCRWCQGELHDVILLEALGPALAPSRVGTQAAPPPESHRGRSGTLSGFQVSVPQWAPAPPVLMMPHPAGAISRIGVARAAGRGRARPWALAAGMAAGVAAILMILIERRQSSNPDDLLPNARPFAARVVYPPADRYRPLRVMRGEQDRPSPSIEALGRLAAGGDEETLVAAYLLAGVDRQAEAILSRTPRTATSDTNRAVLAMQSGRWHEARGLLEAVLVVDPHHPQARWNLALVCEQLGDPAAAARAFDAVAVLREPGWSDEAAERARGLRAVAEP
jgi:hypothetical protein